MSNPAPLSAAQIEDFIRDGYVMLPGAFTAEAAAAVRGRIWDLLEVSAEEPSQWTRPVIHLQKTISGPEVDACFTPRLHAAFNQVMGAGRWKEHRTLGWWPVSFPGHHAPPWQQPVQGWHVDGQQFHHHLNSPDQGLLPIFLFSDIDPGGGGTCVRPGSHLVTAQVLQEHEPQGLDAGTLSRLVDARTQDLEVVEVSGKAGDVALIHPFLAHARSENTGSRVRFICNPCFVLHQPMEFERPDGDYSPVERAILGALSGAAV